jgi:hypothetical protein
LGPIGGRDVLLLDVDRGLRRAQLEALGARVRGLAAPVPATTAPAAPAPATTAPAAPDAASASLESRPPESADVLVAFWTGLGLAPAAEPAKLAALSRVLRPEGRILLVEVYGRDDTTHLFADAAREARLVAANDRRGAMLAAGFRVHVLHCWWSFAELDAMSAALAALFPATGADFAATLRRPRLSFNVAVYHRTVERP